MLKWTTDIDVQKAVFMRKFVLFILK